MEFENLILEHRGKVLWLTVNRPRKLNALNVATIAEIDRAMDAAAADSEVWGVCVTGAGDRAFVAGGPQGTGGFLQDRTDAQTRCRRR